MTDFIPGITLSRSFFHEAVKPLLEQHFPALPYAAALIGDGSEVLGFDTPMSTDHDWGPRLLLFLNERNFRLASRIDDVLRTRLPPLFREYSTSFSPPDAADDGTQRLQPGVEGAVHHRVDITTFRNFTQRFLDFDIRQPARPADWLSFPEQKLLALTSGEVFYDSIGLREARGQFSYYPRDIWYYLLAAGWKRIGQEEHLVGRAGYTGDELGASIITARLVRDAMRLCFLMERKYAPYAKWFGAAFQKLSCAKTMTPLLVDALRAAAWQERDTCLAKVFARLAHLHNRLGITNPAREVAGQFFDRPFHVIEHTGKFAAAITACIDDAVVKGIAQRCPMGGIDQVSDNTDLLSDARWRLVVRELYEG